MIIKTYEAGPFDANNYLVIDKDTNEAVLIDCSENKQEIINEVNMNNLNVKYILITHGHFDHVLGINDMKNALGAEVIVPAEDLILIENINEHARFFGQEVIDIPVHDKTYDEGIELKLGKHEIEVIRTPGHTEGGVSLLIGKNLFSGDTLFKDSFGRTDLYGGNTKKLLNSIVNELFNLPDNTIVYPGHGPSTTIGYEKVHNDIMHYVKRG
ncbi:TPA: MBL fold metallo-hydrolase [Candidatus Scatousia excrementigallinarum]|uniref:MBL fold metallo-hydrolase n=1 Tax=Candidatus Scatousia excrementigallinarum TaxID=2840935 RepID=A0A9D1JN62_9BACT|nr:MBL fold metallo-hydrolase [Candidatus Scatousia excrementigallinarum]